MMMKTEDGNDVDDDDDVDDDFSQCDGKLQVKK